MKGLGTGERLRPVRRGRPRLRTSKIFDTLKELEILNEDKGVRVKE